MIKKIIDKIPALLSSNVSIFIFLFLFVYLVLFGVVGLFSVWFAKNMAPNANVQLVLGNYTNVTSALGAAIAAGASTSAHASLKKLHDKHDTLKQSLDSLHAKVDELTSDSRESSNKKQHR
ncbi:MAG: hypothetical protein WAW91_01335 [Candidatus Nanoperiomorbaceae bacterium]